MLNYSCDDMSDLTEEAALILIQTSVASPAPVDGVDWELQRVQAYRLLLSIVVGRKERLSWLFPPSQGVVGLPFTGHYALHSACVVAGAIHWIPADGRNCCNISGDVHIAEKKQLKCTPTAS